MHEYTFQGAAGATGVGVDWIEVAGHSLAGGGGARYAPLGGYAFRTKAALGIPKWLDYSIGGAIACRPNAVGTGDGGYGWLMRNVLRPGMPAWSFTAGAPYNPQSQLCLVHFGLNDIGILGAAKPLPFQTAMRTILARFCASSVFLYDHAALAYTGTWPTMGILDAAASTTDSKGVKYTQTVGDKVVFTTPADFPAGRVVDACLWIGSTYGPMTYGVKIDGVAQPDLVLTPVNMTDQTVASQNIMHTLRIGTGNAGDPYGAPLSAGAHTIELSLKAAGTLAVDSFAIEADPQDGPVLVCPLPNRPANYSIWSGWPGGPSMNDAVIDQWKDYERAVLAEFPGRVVSDQHGLGVDLDDAALVRTTDGTGDFIGDGAHPNDRGHGKWVELISNVVRASPLLTDRIRARPFVDPRPRNWKQVGKVNGAGAFATGWSNYGAVGLQDLRWRADEKRRVYVQGSLRAAAGATPTILPAGTLPKPANLASKVANQYDGVSAWSQKAIRLQNSGALTMAGTIVTAANNILEFDFDYQAEM